MNTQKEENFTQVCVWPACIVGTDKVSDFKQFMFREFKVRVQYLEEIKTDSDKDSQGNPIKDTGARNDLFFAVHDKDVGKFAMARLQYGIRWLEDVLDKENYQQIIYPPRVYDYKCWKE